MGRKQSCASWGMLGGQALGALQWYPLMGSRKGTGRLTTPRVTGNGGFLQYSHMRSRKGAAAFTLLFRGYVQ